MRLNSPTPVFSSLHGTRGQVLVLFVLMLVALLLCVGLAIDLGFAYISKASLSKAVDAAAITGAKNMSSGQAEAERLARATFAANYTGKGRDAHSPTLNIGFTQDASNNTRIDVSASTVINTFFIGILPEFKTLSVGATAEAIRVKLLMTLVLDRSGSMGSNGGAVALPPAVSDFIDQFDDSQDRVGLSSFGSNATADLAPQKNFKTLVNNRVNNWPALVGGRTFSDGGLTIADTMIRNTALAAGENVFKVVVFFTDGYANTFQDTFSCTPGKLNLGQSADPSDGPQPWPFSFTDPITGNSITPPCSSTDFQSIDGTTKSISKNNRNIWLEGQLRALATAKKIRGENITVYSIGLGDDINQDFLMNVANDPRGSQFDSTQPPGQAVFAPQADDLKQAFQQISQNILLRLTQ
jgi:Flp pilus assembly protein TadG